MKASDIVSKNIPETTSIGEAEPRAYLSAILLFWQNSVID